MSISAAGNGYSRGEKGQTAEAFHCCPGVGAGPSENIRRTVTLRGALSFCVGVLLPFAVNVGVSPGFAVFCLPFEKRKEKKKMRRMTRLMTLVLALAMLLTLSACGSANTDAPNAAPVSDIPGL